MSAADSAVESLACQMPFTARIAATARARRVSSTRCARATRVISASRCRRLAAVTRRYEKVAAALARYQAAHHARTTRKIEGSAANAQHFHRPELAHAKGARAYVERAWNEARVEGSYALQFTCDVDAAPL